MLPFGGTKEINTLHKPKWFCNYRTSRPIVQKRTAWLEGLTVTTPRVEKNVRAAEKLLSTFIQHKRAF